MPRRRARTPEARENQLINMAYDLAEQQFAEGTASAMVTTHFLKMGSQREKLERERLKAENDHLRAKIESLENMKEISQLYAQAMDAYKSYSSGGSDEE